MTYTFSENKNEKRHNSVNTIRHDCQLNNGLPDLKMSKICNKVLFILSHFMFTLTNHSSWLKPHNFVGKCAHFFIYPIHTTE